MTVVSCLQIAELSISALSQVSVAMISTSTSPCSTYMQRPARSDFLHEEAKEDLTSDRSVSSSQLPPGPWWHIFPFYGGTV